MELTSYFHHLLFIENYLEQVCDTNVRLLSSLSTVQSLLNYVINDHLRRGSSYYTLHITYNYTVPLPPLSAQCPEDLICTHTCNEPQLLSKQTAFNLRTSDRALGGSGRSTHLASCFNINTNKI